MEALQSERTIFHLSKGGGNQQSHAVLTKSFLHPVKFLVSPYAMYHPYNHSCYYFLIAVSHAINYANTEWLGSASSYDIASLSKWSGNQMWIWLPLLFLLHLHRMMSSSAPAVTITTAPTATPIATIDGITSQTKCNNFIEKLNS